LNRYGGAIVANHSFLDIKDTRIDSSVAGMGGGGIAGAVVMAQI
jgi:hypothetical protein